MSPSEKTNVKQDAATEAVSLLQEIFELDSDDWSRVLFSDETMMCQFERNIRFVRRPLNTRFSPKFTVPTMKHSQKVMVWGCFSASGRGSLYFVDRNKTVNSVEYTRWSEKK